MGWDGCFLNGERVEVICIMAILLGLDGFDVGVVHVAKWTATAARKCVDEKHQNISRKLGLQYWIGRAVQVAACISVIGGFAFGMIASSERET